MLVSGQWPRNERGRIGRIGLVLEGFAERVLVLAGQADILPTSGCIRSCLDVLL